MKCVVGVVLFSCFVTSLHAQTLSPQVFATNGGYSTNGGNSVSWTIGEPFTQPLSSTNHELYQGFQQPYLQLKIVNLKLFIEGYYIAGTGEMQPVLLNQGVTTSTTQTDTIHVELRDVVDPSHVVESADAVLSTTGNATTSFSHALIGSNYLIAIKHRNAIQTWSANYIGLAETNSYDFSMSASQAYDDNQRQVDPGIWALYSGDMNQDEYIDPFDYPLFDTDNYNQVTGVYANTDLNGDGYVDPFDYPLFDLNNYNQVTSVHP